MAANKIGADVLLLNTSFAGPALGDVVKREGVDVLIYDDELTDAVDKALSEGPGCIRILGRTDDPEAHDETVEKLIAAHAGQRPVKFDRIMDLEDLRAAPDTAGTPAVGTRIRILDGDFRDVEAGATGQIYVHNTTQFDG